MLWKPIPSPKGHLESGAEDHRGGSDEDTGNARVGEDRAGSTRVRGAADDTARETGSRGDTAVEESRAARALDSLVERRLAGEEDGRGEAGRVWGRRLEGDVRGDDVASARLAEGVLCEGGLEKEEEEVVARERGRVGGNGRDDLGGITARVRGARRGGDRDGLGDAGKLGCGLRRGRRNAGDTVVPTVVLGADRVLEGREGVKHVVSPDHILVLVGGELVTASLLEVRELGADGGVRARRARSTDSGKRGLDIRRRGSGCGSVSRGCECTGGGDEGRRAAAEGSVLVEGGEERLARRADPRRDKRDLELKR